MTKDEIEMTRNCDCKRSDAWRCARDRGLDAIVCHCACHAPTAQQENAAMTLEQIEQIRACLDDGSYTRLEQKDFTALCDQALLAHDLAGALRLCKGTLQPDIHDGHKRLADKIDALLARLP